LFLSAIGKGIGCEGTVPSAGCVVAPEASNKRPVRLFTPGGIAVNLPGPIGVNVFWFANVNPGCAETCPAGKLLFCTNGFGLRDGEPAVAALLAPLGEGVCPGAVPPVAAPGELGPVCDPGEGAKVFRNANNA